MNQQLITKTLVEKRREILNEIDNLEKSIKVYKDNLITLSKTIQIFDSSFEMLVLPKIKKVSTTKKFAYGELRRVIFDILKKDIQLSTHELLQKIMTIKNIEYVDSIDERNFQKGVLAILNNAHKSNLIEKVGKDGLNIVWKIKELS